VWRASLVAFLATSADNFVLFLLLWLAEPQGWSGMQTALVVLVLRVPTLASGVLLGRAVDRRGARPMMLADLSARASLLLLLLGASWGTRALPLLPVLVLGGIAGALSPATYAGVRWLVPRIVGEREVEQANAVVALSEQLPLLVGTALVGPSLGLLGPAASVLVPAGMLLVAAALALGLPEPSTTPSAAVSTGRHRGGHPGRRWPPPAVALIALSTAYYFVYGPFETASPSWVRGRLDAGEGVYSLLWALFGFGALLTLSLGPLLARRRRPGLLNGLGALAWGLVMLPVVVVREPLLAGLVFFLGGVVWGPYTTIEASALQRWVDPARHGVVFGFQRSLLATATPLGAGLGALALEHVAPNVVLGISAAACTVAGLAALTSRDLRQGPESHPI
jgi:predicted MFS family arabinose efflux permease